MEPNELESSIIEKYTDRNLSVAQIAHDFNITISKVRYCLNKFEIPKRSISEAITNLNITKFGKIPFNLKKNLSVEEEELRVAGTMLYWAEGAKIGSNNIKFVNSDPDMIKLFLRFLRDICGIHEERLKPLLHLYHDQDRHKLEKFWSGVAKIPLTRFNKSHIHQGKIGTYRKKSPYGTIALNYSDKKLLGKILSWIEEYKYRHLP